MNIFLSKKSFGAIKILDGCIATELFPLSSVIFAFQI